MQRLRSEFCSELYLNNIICNKWVYDEKQAVSNKMLCLVKACIYFRLPRMYLRTAFDRFIKNNYKDFQLVTRLPFTLFLMAHLSYINGGWDKNLHLWPLNLDRRINNLAILHENSTALLFYGKLSFLFTAVSPKVASSNVTLYHNY